MCNDCGCGMGGGSAAKILHGLHPFSPAHTHTHTHGPDDAMPDAAHRTVSIARSILAKNDAVAAANRSAFHSRKLLVLNVVSGPGSGKTTLMGETIARLKGLLRVAVIVGDLATENDANRLRQTGVPVIQINTGTVCHLDAEMIRRAVANLDLSCIDLLIIENVGNLVCPADFDLGESLRVVLLSTTEGEDKPLKYPPLFHSSHVAIITKADLAAATGFAWDNARANLQQISHHAVSFEVSARTGVGMDGWCDYLVREHARLQA